jgi:hypothetical protein
MNDRIAICQLVGIFKRIFIDGFLVVLCWEVCSVLEYTQLWLRENWPNTLKAALSLPQQAF